MTPERRFELIARYAAGPDEVTRSLDGFTHEGVSAHPLPGKWSAREIVNHLADSEAISAIRVRRLLAEDRAVIAGYDQEAYATRLRYNERPIEPALAMFRLARETTTPLLRMMAEEQWTRVGWHTESGLYTPEHWLEIYAVHAHDHAAQIVRLKQALGR